MDDLYNWYDRIQKAGNEIYLVMVEIMKKHQLTSLSDWIEVLSNLEVRMIDQKRG